MRERDDAPAGAGFKTGVYAVYQHGAFRSIRRLADPFRNFIRADHSRCILADLASGSQHTISWLPQSLDVRTWSLFPEPGVNLDLYRTLEAVYIDREHVTMWRPFRIQQVVYERSLRVQAILDSGAAEYRAISTPRNLLVSDCIHAVAAVDPIFGRGHYPLIRIGKPASRYIARQMMTRSVFDQWQGDNSWLIPRLGLDRYPIEFVPPQQIPKQNCFLCRCSD